MGSKSPPKKGELLIHEDQQLQRIAASPPLPQPDSRSDGGHHHARPQRRVPTSRMLSSFFLKDAAWGLPHAAVSTNNEQQANPEPYKPTSNLRSPSLTLCQTPALKPADSL